MKSKAKLSFTPARLQLSYSQTLLRNGTVAMGIMVATRYVPRFRSGGCSNDTQALLQTKDLIMFV